MEKTLKALVALTIGALIGTSIACTKPVMEDMGFVPNPPDVVTPPPTTTTTTTVEPPKTDTSTTTTGTDTSTTEETVYAVIATGEGSVTWEVNGTEVVLTITPDGDYDVVDVQGGDFVDGYKFADRLNPRGPQTITVNFKGDVEPVRIYLQENFFVPTVGFPRSYEIDQQRPTGYGNAESMMNVAIEHSTPRMEAALNNTTFIWIPNSLELPNGVIEERVAHTAGGRQCNHDHTSTAFVNMLHLGDAGIIFHELGHTFHDDCSITPAQDARVLELYLYYINIEFERLGLPTVNSWDELVQSGAHRQLEGYQFNGGFGEWFACSVSAYHNTSGNWTTNGGNGTIGSRTDLQNKYPMMYDLMVEIFG